MKPSILIPARGGSKSVPRKNLHPINGKPLLWYTIEAARNSMVDDVYVSTDDLAIGDFARGRGVNVLERPAEISGDTSSIEEVIHHFIENVECDIIVLLSPTSPFTRYLWVNQGITKILNGKCDSVFSGMGMESNDMLFWDKEKMAPVNYDIQNRGVRQDRKDKYVIETGAFYITTKEAFLKSNCRLSGKIEYIEIPFWAHFELDNISDLRHIEYILKGLNE